VTQVSISQKIRQSEDKDLKSKYDSYIADTKTGRHTGKQAGRQTGRQADRQAGKPTNIKTDKEQPPS